MASDPVARFWASVAIGTPEECWHWQKAKLPAGYGRFKPQSYVQVYAHRYSYELAYGPIPPGLFVDHLCCTKDCVNPAHLDVCSQTENTRRGIRRRKLCGNGLHDVTVPDAYAIVGSKRVLYCRLCRAAAEERRQEKRRSRSRGNTVVE